MENMIIKLLSQNEYTVGADFKPSKLYNDYIKRTIDFILALILAGLVSPVIFIVALLIKIDSKGSVFYRGLRTGYHGKEFRIYKFRSMVPNADKLGGGTTALNDSRITRVGRFIRKTKLDEVPQLFNIILGQMSFVGPRPELPLYTKQFEGIEKIILSVRPGITDISSIRFINLDEIVGETNADEMFEKYVLKRKNELRVKYVLEQSFILDIKLFMLTVWRVIYKALMVICWKRGTVNSGTNTTKKF